MTARLICSTVVLSLLPSTAFTQGPPPPPTAGVVRDAAPDKIGTARLSGRVVSLESGRPIRGAVVTARGSELREGHSVSTDAEGRWELRDLPAGRLNLSASKGGYVLLQYGQQRPHEAGKPIVLANGQSIDKLDFALPRASAVTGRVVDEFGEPVSNVRVSTMRYRFANGQRRLTSAGMTDMTDDLGQFRVHGLPPGDYYVVAQPPNVGAFLASSSDRMGYTQTFYPASYTPGDATKLTLTVGQEAQNLVIALARARLATLSGTLTKADGKPIVTGTVRVQETGSGPTSTNMGVVRGDGTWRISGVVPGEYRLTAMVVEQSFEEIAVTGSSSGPMQIAQMPITVTGDDITGLALTTNTGGSLEGTIRFEGATPSLPVGTAILATDAGQTGIGIAAAGTIKPDWSFQIRGIYGRRILRPVGLPRGWHLKSIMLNGLDVIDTGIDVPPATRIDGIEVSLTQTAAELSGTAQSAKGTPITDYVVVLFPPEAERWGWQSRFVQVARPDQAGRFTVQGLPEGTYLAAALEYMEPGEEGNPDFLEKLKPLATRVSVADGEKQTLTLKLSAQ